MALACDFILMAEEATLALPETALGTFVGGGVTHILPQLIGPARAKELVYTGKVIDGRAAIELGLALGCHPVTSTAGGSEIPRYGHLRKSTPFHPFCQEYSFSTHHNSTSRPHWSSRPRPSSPA